MTPENKKTVKVLAIAVGIILVLTVIALLIGQKIKRDREAREESGTSDGGSAPPATGSGSGSSSSGGGSSTSSFGGRTFSKTEIEKMQSFLFNMGAMAMNDLIVSSIRDTGGIDGKIGTGFKTAYNEAIRIGIIKSLNDLYTQAMKF